MRTKEEISVILSKRKLPEMVSNSTWADLVSSISSLSQAEKDSLVQLIISGSSKKVGDRLKRALHENAKERAVASVDILLADDNLSLTELDSLI